MDVNTQRIKPYEGTEPYIFISYAHRDYERLVPILRELEKRGYRFWYDEGIDPGTEWPESIANHLENSSACLSFISPYSAESKNCRREINFALSRNIALLTVFLEETEISSGLEMQISTYQSIIAYKYPDLPSLMERIVSVDVMESCRGKPGETAATEESVGRKTPAVPKKRFSPLMIIIPLVLAAAIAIWLFWNGSRREESAGRSSEQAEETTLTATPLPAATPNDGEHAYSEEYLQSVNNWTDHLWDEVPITANDSIPEGYRVLIYEEWGYGSLLMYGNDEGSIRFALTDDRIPDGFPISQTPGKNDPYWCLMLMLGGKDILDVIIEEWKTPTSFADFETSVVLLSGNDMSFYDGFPYSITGRTFIFEIQLPEQFSIDDIQGVGISLGTERDGYVDTYDFYT